MINLQEISVFLENLPDTKIKEKEYTLAHIFRKNRNENFSSDWLAYILDPTLFKSYEPINVFLSLLDVPAIDENQEIIVEREVSLGDYGRIDLLITTDKYLIGIENKIDAWTRENQCEDYEVALNELKGEKKAIGVLLSPQGNNVFSANDFIDLTYEQLIEEFKSISIDFIKNLRSAFLLKDYITYMEENIMQNKVKFDIEDKTTAYLLNQADKIDKINAFLTVQKANMRNCIENAMSDVKEKLGRDWDILVCGGYWQLYKKGWKENSIEVHYEVMALAGTNNSLAYTDYYLVVHDESSKKNQKFKDGFKPILNDVRQSIRQKEFSLDFSSNENFQNSLDTILENLLYLAEKTNGVIDKYITEYKSNLEG